MLFRSARAPFRPAAHVHLRRHQAGRPAGGARDRRWGRGCLFPSSACFQNPAARLSPPSPPPAGPVRELKRDVAEDLELWRELFERRVKPRFDSAQPPLLSPRPLSHEWLAGPPPQRRARAAEGGAGPGPGPGSSGRRASDGSDRDGGGGAAAAAGKHSPGSSPRRRRRRRGARGRASSPTESRPGLLGQDDGFPLAAAVSVSFNPMSVGRQPRAVSVSVAASAGAAALVRGAGPQSRYSLSCPETRAIRGSCASFATRRTTDGAWLSPSFPLLQAAELTQPPHPNHLRQIAGAVQNSIGATVRSQRPQRTSVRSYGVIVHRSTSPRPPPNARGQVVRMAVGTAFSIGRAVAGRAASRRASSTSAATSDAFSTASVRRRCGAAPPHSAHRLRLSRSRKRRATPSPRSGR